MVFGVTHMAKKRTPGSRPGLIYCENCGEEYSDTYRHCPFCIEYEAEQTGKQVSLSNLLGGGYKKVTFGKVLSIIISVAIIVALCWAVIFKIIPMVQLGHSAGNMDPEHVPSSSPVSPSPEVSPVTTPEPTPEVTPTPVPTPTPAPTPNPDLTPNPDVTAIPNTAESITLNRTEFAFSNQYPHPVTLSATFYPYGSTGKVNWSSSNNEIATVDANGKVSHGTRPGTAIITAILYNGETATCKVYNQVTNG